jgi:DNA-binding beta-propeller fold protein YncE
MNKSNLLLAAVFGTLTLMGVGRATAQDFIYVTDNTGSNSTIPGNSISIINPEVAGGDVTTLSSSLLDDPTGIALDDFGSAATNSFFGDLFIASPGNDSIVTYNPITGKFLDYSTNADYSSLQGLAFDDSNGNLYAASSPSPTSGTVYLLTKGSTTPVNYASTSIGGPQGIAIDGNGNLFVTVTTASPGLYDSQIVEITTSGTVESFYPGRNTFLGLGNNPPLATPAGVAIQELSGNLYVSNSGNNTVSEVTLAPVGSTAIGSQASLDDPRGIIFDLGDNLFVADYADNTVSEYTAGANGTYNYLTSFAGADMFSPDFLAVDTVGLPVPEPSTYAMLLGGLAMLFLVVRQRRAPVAVKI